MTGPASFSEFFSFDQFEAFVALRRRTDIDDGKRGEIYREMVASSMRPAFAKYLGMLLDAGRLRPLSGTGGRRGHIMDAWNGLFENDGQRKRHLETLAHRFAHAFLFPTIYEAARGGVGGPPKYADDRAAYDAMIAILDAGDLGWWQTVVEDYCFVSGERFQAQFASWALQLGRTDGPSGGPDFVPMRDIEAPAVAECEVEFETGDVLIADWFRIDAFTNAAKAAEDDGNDIGSLLGRIGRTREYAEKLNFLSIHVGNTLPDVFCEDGVFTVGRFDEEAEGTNPPKPLGYVCTDLWWTTVIDRKRLVDIVAMELGTEAAETTVAAYLEKHDVVRAKVAPGRYRAYFSGDSEDFAERFHSPEVETDASVQPFFVLSPRPLEMTDKPASAAPAP